MRRVRRIFLNAQYNTLWNNNPVSIYSFESTSLQDKWNRLRKENRVGGKRTKKDGTKISVKIPGPNSACNHFIWQVKEQVLFQGASQANCSSTGTFYSSSKGKGCGSCSSLKHKRKSPPALLQIPEQCRNHYLTRSNWPAKGQKHRLDFQTQLWNLAAKQHCKGRPLEISHTFFGLFFWFIHLNRNQLFSSSHSICSRVFSIWPGYY